MSQREAARVFNVSRDTVRKMTTKLHAVVDALGLPLRIHPTPGQYGDRPRAEVLLEDLHGVGHVIADATYDADRLRAFITDELGATPQIKANPRRAATPPIDRHPHKEHHQIEYFLNNSNASAGSPCAAKRSLPPSWASSISHAL
jgi:transposase